MLPKTKGSWHTYGDAPGCEHYDHLTTVEKQRLVQMLSYQPSEDDHGQIHLMFDPETRRIQAMEISSSPVESGGPLLTLAVLARTGSSERALFTIARWKQAIADGWFDGI